MRSDTVIWMAIRNFGAANEDVVVIRGEMKQMILELAKYMAQVNPKKRIAIGFARDKTDAMIATSDARSKKTQAEDSLMSDLERIMMSGSDELRESNDASAPSNESGIEDDYVPGMTMHKLPGR